MSDHHEHHDHGHENLLKDRGAQGAEGFVDELGAVVKRHDRELRNTAVCQCFRGKPRRNFLDPRSNPVDHRQWIRAVASHHDTAHGLGSHFVEGAAPDGWPEADVRNIFEINRISIFGCSHGRARKIVDVFQKTDAAHQVLDTIHVDGTGANIEVRAQDCALNFLQRHASCAHRVGVDVDLIFLHEAAD